MTGQITPSTFSSGYKKNYVQQLVSTDYMDMEKTNEKIFKKTDSALIQDLFQGTSSLGYAPVVDGGGQVTFDSQGQTFQNYITKVSYGLGVSITWEALNYIQQPVMQILDNTATYLKQALHRTTEKAAAAVIDSGFTTTYGDGVAMLSASHPTQSGLQSNVLSVSSDLTYTAVVDLITQMRKAKDYRGNPQDVSPKKLLIPVDLWRQAAEIFESKLNPDNANNAVNAIVANGISLEMIDWKYLSSPTAWYILTDATEGGLAKTVKSNMEVMVKETEQMNGFGRNYIAQTAFGVGFGGEFRAIYGTPGI